MTLPDDRLLDAARQEHYRHTLARLDLAVQTIAEVVCQLQTELAPPGYSIHQDRAAASVVRWRWWRYTATGAQFGAWVDSESEAVHDAWQSWRRER